MKTQYIFLHIYKTGGQTLRNVISRQYKKSNYFDIGKNSLEDFTALDSSEKAAVEMMFGHTKYGIDRLYGNDTPKKYITMVREPVSRIISLFKYVNQSINLDLHKLMPEEERADLRSFVLNIDKYSPYHGNNGMCKTIVGMPKDFPKGNLWDDLIVNELTQCDNIFIEATQRIESNFITVGVLEYFDESLILFKKLLNWKIPLFYVKKNATNKGVEKYDSATIDLIKELNKSDIDLYNYVLKNFHVEKGIHQSYIKKEMKKLNFNCNVYNFCKKHLFPIIKR